MTKDNTKHTKGPWTRSGREGDHVYIYHSDDRGGAASLVVAKVTCRDAWEPEQMANAALIAAAPDLLEALQDALVYLASAVEEYEDQVRGGKYDEAQADLDEARNVHAKAIAALRKAEGRAEVDK